MTKKNDPYLDMVFNNIDIEAREKFLEYDPNAWIIWSINDKCNLKCVYCDNKNNINNKKIIVDINRLMISLKRSNKRFVISISGGGEPFLIDNIMDLSKSLTKEYYICFNTNLTSDKIKEFSERINPHKVFYIIASLHIKELENKHLTEKYIKNYKILKDKRFNIIAQVVAYPGLNNEIKKYIDFFKENNIDLAFTPFSGIYEKRLYPEAYTDEELKLFGLEKFQKDIFRGKNKICNTGFNCLFVNRKGDILRCAKNHKVIGNIYDKIIFTKHLVKCPYNFCPCPINEYNQMLFNKAIRSTEVIKKMKKDNHFNINLDNILGRIGLKIDEYFPKEYIFLKRIKDRIYFTFYNL